MKFVCSSWLRSVLNHNKKVYFKILFLLVTWQGKNLSEIKYTQLHWKLLYFEFILSQNHRIVSVGRDLWRSSSPVSLPRLSPRAAHTGRGPGGFWTSPEGETPHPPLHQVSFLGSPAAVSQVIVIWIDIHKERYSVWSAKTKSHYHGLEFSLKGGRQPHVLQQDFYCKLGKIGYCFHIIIVKQTGSGYSTKLEELYGPAVGNDSLISDYFLVNLWKTTWIISS